MENNKKELLEIKRGQTGHGLLIENDGYMTLSDETNKVLKESYDPENWHVPYPFIVNAVFQKADIKNANGRIYPRKVLEREIENYQTRIRERRATGECYTPDTLILTENGWKSLEEVKEGDNILTLNTETNEIEIKPIQRKIEYDYNGEMVRLQNRQMNDLVTPNHKFPVYNRYYQFYRFATAEEIENGFTDMSHSYIPKRGIWTKEGSDFFMLRGVTDLSDQAKRFHPQHSEDVKIPMNIFMKFMGIYLSEGDYGKDDFSVRVHQLKEENCIKIKELFDELQECGFKYSIVIRKEDGKKVFTIRDPRLHAYLKPLGNCYTKYIPIELKQQSREDLKFLYDWFVMGDGRVKDYELHKKRGYNKTVTDDVFSVSKQLILDLNEIQLKIGYNGNYHVDNIRKDRMIGDRLIESKNSKPLHFSYRNVTKSIYLDKRFLKCSREEYSGKVMCVEVENHTWFVMSNGFTHWTGNCNHPDSSTIDLGRVSHNIIELHWEGNTVVGKLELNLTRGFIKYGICSSLGDTVANLLLNGYKIGVSSRAIGSVEQRNGILYVGDDLEILCWDIVESPSTPGAYIVDNEALIGQYVESKEYNNGKLLEKIEKIEKILL